MRYQGRLHNWNDNKGFGFVAPNGGGDKAFVHIKAFARASRRPVDGDAITYTVARDAQGRLRAEGIRFALEPARHETAGKSGAFGPIVLAIFVAMLATLILSGRLSPTAVVIYVAMSLATLLTYRSDKIAANEGRWRTPESTLHILGLACGWPGALLAQRWFRHKSKKTSFLTTFWATVILNIIAVAWFASDGGHTMLKNAIG